MVLKAFALALVSAAMGFFAGNFLAIMSLAIYQAATHNKPDYTFAYRVIGVTCGVIAGISGFVGGIVWDVRKHRHG
jgi:hypothetical protein